MTKRYYAVTGTDGMPIFVQEGTLGYFPADTPSKLYQLWCDCRDHQTPAETEAAKAGSMFGWDCPGADPKNYDAQGKPISRKSQQV